MLKLTRSTVLTLLLVILLFLLGYYGYSSLRSGVSGGKDEPPPSPLAEQGLVPSEFLGLAATLEASKIDTSFFQDPLFRELKDGIALPPSAGPIGRTNPFSPLK